MPSVQRYCAGYKPNKAPCGMPLGKHHEGTHCRFHNFQEPGYPNTRDSKRPDRHHFRSANPDRHQDSSNESSDKSSDEGEDHPPIPRTQRRGTKKSVPAERFMDLAKARQLVGPKPTRRGDAASGTRRQEFQGPESFLDMISSQPQQPVSSTEGPSSRTTRKQSRSDIDPDRKDRARRSQNQIDSEDEPRPQGRRPKRDADPGPSSAAQRQQNKPNDVSAFMMGDLKFSIDAIGEEPRLKKAINDCLLTVYDYAYTRGQNDVVPDASADSGNGADSKKKRCMQAIVEQVYRLVDLQDQYMETVTAD